MSCCGECGDNCALLLALALLGYVASEQAKNVRTGRAPLPWLDDAYSLYSYIKMGVCGKTATLPFEFVPDLEPHLKKLPRPARKALEDAIVQAVVGQGLSEQPTQQLPAVKRSERRQPPQSPNQSS